MNGGGIRKSRGRRWGMAERGVRFKSESEVDDVLVASLSGAIAQQMSNM